MRMVCRMVLTIWNVVELSSPVDISSMKSARPGVTIISAVASILGSGSEIVTIMHSNNSNDTLPVVSRFFCPPDMPLSILFPTIVSAQISNPKIFDS
ncbi:Os09g0334050 [Oryza sativa Japonica Group]|uniref:Os09g0334050 protein n=1 Tax=Oryza sativa subsp. japonica TaxID=39947 RepID=A0A0P0XLI3_ORYSJ|nr:hypothetical protein EE612_047059 [Oryza sativa]BAT07541.1 Os09g0334050 [Oryza sativa Japonica Group]